MQTLLPFVQHNNVFLITPMESDCQTHNTTTPRFAFPAASSYSNHNLEEVLHMCFNHPSDEKLVRLDGKVKGLPHSLKHTRLTRGCCAHCDEANAMRQNHPSALDTFKDPMQSEVWHWDMLDMYGSMEVNALFTKYNIEHWYSNVEQQFQNAAAETIVNMIGHGVRVLLLQSGMPPNFWGLAMLQVVNVCNCLPHMSLDWEIPYTLQTGRIPDVSWFRCFGCSAVVHQGKNLIEHGKAAPHCESGVCVGNGLMLCHKCFFIYSALTNAVYASTDCTFDEMLFPARATDQCMYCYYDKQPMEQFRADLHAQQLTSTLLTDLPLIEISVSLTNDLPNLSSVQQPVWNTDDLCINDDVLNLALSSNMDSTIPAPDTSENVSTFNSAVITSFPGGGSEQHPPSSPGGGNASVDDSFPGGGSPTAASLSAGE
eukprot:278357-Rhodomonas_salina.1